MRLATFSYINDPVLRLGVVRNDQLLDLPTLLGSHSREFPATMLELIERGPQVWRRMSELIEQCASGELPVHARVSPEQAVLHAPIPRPRKNVVCLGLNYVAHMEESAKARGREVKIPEAPVFFTKAPTAVAGPNDAIAWDQAVTSQVDFEAELGVIIGIGGKNISRQEALDHVFGYTVINDFSARDLQLGHYQWFKGKSLDGFCPIGPHVVTADEFGDPQTKKICLRVNGETKQSADTSQMIFTVAVIIEFLSRGMTLEPGDIISTGTPEGVGLGRTPPEYLNDGDLVETEVEGIGVLRNRIVAVQGTAVENRATAAER
ncbi:MAG: fumarylacetoacetate hydrolase family protein [Acidobacteria bacterium]|nr:fumarylacetoacetate hydrolase family protein [Acidobacteriota bacterium]